MFTCWALQLPTKKFRGNLKYKTYFNGPFVGQSSTPFSQGKQHRGGKTGLPFLQSGSHGSNSRCPFSRPPGCLCGGSQTSLVGIEHRLDLLVGQLFLLDFLLILM